MRCVSSGTRFVVVVVSRLLMMDSAAAVKPPHRVNNLIEALCSALSLTMLCKSFHQVPSSPRRLDHEPRLLARIWQLAVAPLASRSRKHIATINHAKYVHRPDASVRACARASVPLFLLFIQI